MRHEEFSFRIRINGLQISDPIFNLVPAIPTDSSAVGNCCHLKARTEERAQSVREEHISNDAEADDCNSVGKVYLSRFLRKLVPPTPTPDRTAAPSASPSCGIFNLASVPRYAKLLRRPRETEEILHLKHRVVPSREKKCHLNTSRSRHRTFAKLGS